VTIIELFVNMELLQVLSGEIKGKALAKVNQQAFEEYNDSALVPCPYCAR